MLFNLNKHYIKNFKNFLISQYLLKNKQIFFNKILNLKINFTTKNFFLSTFLLYTFCIFKYKYIIKKQKYNTFLPVFSFFFIFNTFYYSFLQELNFFNKITKNLIILNFYILNFFLNPISFLLKKKFRWIKQKLINIKIFFFFKKKNLKFFQFYLNFFQVPIFLKK